MGNNNRDARQNRHALRLAFKSWCKTSFATTFEMQVFTHKHLWQKKTQGITVIYNKTLYNLSACTHKLMNQWWSWFKDRKIIFGRKLAPQFISNGHTRILPEVALTSYCHQKSSLKARQKDRKSRKCNLSQVALFLLLDLSDMVSFSNPFAEICKCYLK